MSFNITVSVSDDFAKEAKRLAKKYPSFKQDYKEFLDSIKENPLQGDEITKNIRKIRMAIKSKGKGKSGGARVITFNILTDVQNGQVVLLLIYDKEDASTVKTNVVKQIVRDLKFNDTIKGCPIQGASLNSLKQLKL
nr:addiction module toxin RelE [uncultured Prevotella sp.]